MNKKTNILIVEDDHVTADRIQSDLRLAGYGISGIATNLASAITLMEKKAAPDLALIDLKLDGPEDGIITAQELLKMQWMPIIFMTGEVDIYKDAVQRSKVTSPAAFLEKPLRIRELISQIDLTLHNFLSIGTFQTIKEQTEFIVLPTGKAYLRIEQKEIIHIEADGGYSKLFLTEHEIKKLSLNKSQHPLVVSVNIGRLTSFLAPYFYRLSRSYIININYVQKIESDQFTLHGQQIAIPEGRRNVFLKHLKAIKSR